MSRKLNGAHVFFLPLTLAATLLTGCVTEEVPMNAPRGPTLFSFPVTGSSRLMEAGSYHGTNLFFEIDLTRDLSPDWMSTHEEIQLQLQFIVPRIDRRREIYEVGNLHSVVLTNSRWEVGQHRYPRRNRSRLYVFKSVPGEFKFAFRGHEIVVESKRRWKPSVYYYFEETALEPDTPTRRGRPSAIQRRQISREVVQIGISTIELFPGRRDWRLNGRPVKFNPEIPLVLRGSVKFVPSAAD